MPDLGPVSRALEQTLANEVRRQGIVLWLDKDGAYNKLVDALAARTGQGGIQYPVVPFRGSFLDLMFRLESFGSGLDKQPLLIHLPGFTPESVRSTPVLELYEAGVNFRKALDTLIREVATGRVTAEEVERFLAKNPTLEDADAWLSRAISDNNVELAAVLDQAGPLMLGDALAQRDSVLASRVDSPEHLAVLAAYANRLTGVDRAWFSFYGEDKKLRPIDNFIEALGAWLLSVEYVNDLRRPPFLDVLQPLRQLAPQLMKASCDLVRQLRAKNPDAYERIAKDTEAFLRDEMERMAPEDLGQIDTFPEEDNRVLGGAVEALKAGNAARAKEWCEARLGDKSFWVQRDQSRRWAWTLVAEAAEFAVALAKHPRPLQGARSLDEATEQYAKSGFLVDRAHRRFEQKRLTLLEPRLLHFGALQEVVASLRQQYRAWADAQARDFAALCKEHGFLPSGTLQQRHIYDQVVHPLTLGGEKVAVFAIDAFRFEMATELLEELRGSGATVDLKPRLAELPTITSVGMNVLAPVAQGDRLTVAGAFAGFKAGEFTVKKPEDRARAMGQRSAGKPALLISLSELGDMSTQALTRKLAQHQVIVVHSREIDDAGEADLGLATFEGTLRQVKAAWQHLQLAGVKQAVFTADHGFLMQDETTRERSFGKKVVPQRRHVIDAHARSEAGMLNVSLASLGYDGIEGYLLLLDDTTVFATGAQGATFVHGGNSPQERVIPVLTIARRRAEATSMVEYTITGEPLGDVLGLHRVRLNVALAPNPQGSLGFISAKNVELALRVPDRRDLQLSVKDVSGAGAVRNGRIQLAVGGPGVEVFFSVQGQRDERVRIEAHHPDGFEKVRPLPLDGWFAVSGTLTGPVVSGVPTEVITPAPTGDWAEGIADENVRKVFLHIEKHGAITEAEVTTLLGSPRAFRRFSLEFDTHNARLPFKVRIETADSGKRYVRDAEK